MQIGESILAGNDSEAQNIRLKSLLRFLLVWETPFPALGSPFAHNLRLCRTSMSLIKPLVEFSSLPADTEGYRYPH